MEAAPALADIIIPGIEIAAMPKPAAFIKSRLLHPKTLFSISLSINGPPVLIISVRNGTLLTMLTGDISKCQK
jgi:hypothetical protein